MWFLAPGAHCWCLLVSAGVWCVVCGVHAGVCWCEVFMMVFWWCLVYVVQAGVLLVHGVHACTCPAGATHIWAAG